MKLRKISGAAAFAAFALMAVASTASATTLEIGGTAQTKTVEVVGSLKAGTSSLLKDTSGAFANTCRTATFIFRDETATTGTTVSGPVASLSFGLCVHEPVIVHKGGTLSVERIGTTTNGTVRWSGAEVTVPATILGFVITVNCKTENTDIGTLTGVKEGNATLDVNAVLNCGSSLPSAKWEATYTVTSPTGLGVTG